jgi:hypothetical protein
MEVKRFLEIRMRPSPTITKITLIRAYSFWRNH